MRNGRADTDLEDQEGTRLARRRISRPVISSPFERAIVTSARIFVWDVNINKCVVKELCLVGLRSPCRTESRHHKFLPSLSYVMQRHHLFLAITSGAPLHRARDLDLNVGTTTTASSSTYSRMKSTPFLFPKCACASPVDPVAGTKSAAALIMNFGSG